MSCQVLIVMGDRARAAAWADGLETIGAEVFVAASQAAAFVHLQMRALDVVVLDLALREGSPISVADYAAYRRPGARIVPVTSVGHFDDGSVFQHVPNACTSITRSTLPRDLALIVQHCCAPARSEAGGAA